MCLHLDSTELGSKCLESVSVQYKTPTLASFVSIDFNQNFCYLSLTSAPGHNHPHILDFHHHNLQQANQVFRHRKLERNQMECPSPVIVHSIFLGKTSNAEKISIVYGRCIIQYMTIQASSPRHSISSLFRFHSS